MGHNRKVVEDSIRRAFTWVIFDGEFSVASGIAEVVANWVTAGQYEEVSESSAYHAAGKFGIALAGVVAQNGFDPQRDTIYGGIMTFQNWQDTPFGAIPLPNKFVPYIAVKRGIVHGRLAFLGGQWNVLPGLGNDVSVGADGSVWLIGTNPVGAAADFGVYKWDGSNWAGIGGGGVRIAGAPDGTAWIVNSIGQIYHWNAGSYTLKPGLGTDIGIGADGSVWLIGTNSVGGDADLGVFKWDGNDWAEIGGGGVSISVGADGKAWLVNSVGNIFRLQ
jgi:hypothetical protein